MSDTVQLIFEIIGTIAFSISGAMIGVRKEMDIFGVVILGLTTAVGGGIIRDIILGITPPNTFQNPIYAVIAIITAIIVFLPIVQNIFAKHPQYSEKIMLLMDSVGLGIFTVVGIQTAYSITDQYNLFLLIFVGVVTGVGGGVMRDVMAGDRPYIFVKHFYATASLIGALVCGALWLYMGQGLSMTLGTVVVVVLRLCAAKFRWSLPKGKRINKQKT